MSCGTHLNFEVNAKNMSSDYLKVVFCDTFAENEGNYRVTPFARTNNEILYCHLKNAQKLTSESEEVKTVYKITLDLDVKFEFLPGDTIGVLPSNNKTLINKLFIRLGTEPVADKPCELQIIKGTTKKNPTVPKHLPPKSTLRNIFLNHVDIHTPPKKLFLKSLSRFVHDPHERAKLEQICAPKASQEYTQLITTTCSTLLGLLDTFPSCHPPVELLLEHLPPLQPRPYSISSSPSSGELDLTFFVLKRDDGSRGVCTGWLEDLITQKCQGKIPFYFRQPTIFRLTEKSCVPLILIATGTGIAPFRGFLQGGDNEVWLFYGCRYKDKDFLYREEIEGCVRKLDLAFSREGDKCYVQDRIEKNGEEFYEWISKKDAKIFVCGDPKTVVRDVKSTIVKVLVRWGGMSDSEGAKFVEEMETSGKFVADTWI